MTQINPEPKNVTNDCSSSMIIPTLLECPQKADFEYGFWPYFTTKYGLWSQNFNSAHLILLHNIQFNLFRN